MQTTDMQVSIKIILLLLVIALVRCSHRLDDNSQMRAITINKVRYECRLVSDVSHSESKERASKFILVISDVEGGQTVRRVLTNEHSKGELLSYSNTFLHNDILQLEEGGKFKNCEFSHMEQPNPVKPEIRIAAVFERQKNGDRNSTIVFDDNILNMGRIKFNFSIQ